MTHSRQTQPEVQPAAQPAEDSMMPPTTDMEAKGWVLVDPNGHIWHDTFREEKSAVHMTSMRWGKKTWPVFHGWGYRVRRATLMLETRGEPKPMIKEVGLVVKELRESRGIMRHDMAVLCSISDSEIRWIETGQGKNGPSIWLIDTVARALGIKCSEIIQQAEQREREIEEAKKHANR